MKNGIIIHDYLNNFGGGEKLIKILAEQNKFKIVSSFGNPVIIKEFFSKLKIIILNNLPLPVIIKKILIIYNFKKFTASKNQNCIVSGNYSLFSNLNLIQNKIYYCHSVPKIVFRKNIFYKKNKLLKIFFNIFFFSYKKSFIENLNKFDHVVANSNFTKKKLSAIIKNKKIKVIYPPIVGKKNKKKFFFSSFYLCNNRHEPEKNIDIIIDVFKELPYKKLIITSQGSLTNKLMKKAIGSKNILFLGLVSEKKYKYLLNTCLSVINISEEEDFGMAAVEAMAHGKVTFCLNEGGYKETTKNHYNSIFISKKKLKNDLKFKISKYDVNYLKKMKKNCLKTADKFSEKVFKKKINEIII
jgi:glycosyltransferase involved in cell wall biosynthesis